MMQLSYTTHMHQPPGPPLQQARCFFAGYLSFFDQPCTYIGVGQILLGIRIWSLRPCGLYCTHGSLRPLLPLLLGHAIFKDGLHEPMQRQHTISGIAPNDSIVDENAAGLVELHLILHQCLKSRFLVKCSFEDDVAGNGILVGR